jgi:TRAP-type transport system small permease protein
MNKLLSRIETIMKVLAAACLMTMALVTGFDILGRAGWNQPLYGSEEMVAILAVLVIGLSLPYAHTQGSHIGVEVLYRRMPVKVRRTLKLLTEMAACVLFAVVSWRMFRFAADQEAAGVVTLNLALPAAYPILALAICFSIFTVVLLFQTLTTFRSLRG